MVQENIRVVQSNFCIAPLVGTFASIDTTQAVARLVFKNTSGDTTVSYTFNPNIPQNTTMYYLDYIGPRNQDSVENGMVFVTMESNLTSQVAIKKWDLNKDNTRLDLDYTIIKNTVGDETIKCSNMAAGRYYTNISSTTVTGTMFIELDNVDNVVSGTRLYIGPSTNTAYLNGYEEVQATSISGSTIGISSPNGIPLFNYYNVGDPVTYLGDFYLFSEIAYGNDVSKGSMLTIDNYTGTTLSGHDSALYTNLETSNYGTPYYGTVAIIKNSELLYVDINDHSIQRSVRLNITRPTSQDLLPVYGLAFTSSAVYRLQRNKIVRDDTGQYINIGWATYNFHEDGVFRFVDTLTLKTDPIGILANQETITIIGYVRDQYGMAVSGKTVHFDKISGDVNGLWGEVNREGVTDINGVCSITYTSGWFDESEISNINEDIQISAWTDGSNVLTGSIYVWTTLTFKLNARFIAGPDSSPTYGLSIIKEIENTFSSTNYFTELVQFISSFSVRAYSVFKFPGGHDFWQSTSSSPIVQQWRNFESEMDLIEREIYTGSNRFTQIQLATGDFPVSQTFVSRHLVAGSNEDNVSIAQFRFIIDAVPVPFSEKNNVNATIWIKLAPYGFDLNKSTLIFRVREVSYVGDTGFINYENTSNLVVTEFDAGGGLIGLEVLYTPDEYFHNSAVVHVYLEIYDNAIPPNVIEFDYWFIIIPDYKAPYIINESPGRNEQNVPIHSNISFDILDTEVGVDIETLDLFINNRIKPFIYEELVKGYRITFYNENSFYYYQPIEISVRVSDSSKFGNVLYDMWRFRCIKSIAPIIVGESFFPGTCVRGYDTRTTIEYFEVYDGGDGISYESIELIVGNIIRPTKLIPVIKRTL